MILSIEAASYSQASIALVNAAGLVAISFFEGRREVGATIVSKISELLEQNKLKLSDLEGIVVDCGPGSFTGIRIGIATAQGLSDGAELPLFGMSVFDLYPTVEMDQLILLDAKAGGGFYYEYRPLKGQVEQGFIKPADINQNFPIEKQGIIMADVDGLDISGWETSGLKVLVDAGQIGFYGLEKIKNGEAKPAQALYLHSQIKIKQG